MKAARFLTQPELVQQEFRRELISIADWWVQYAVDNERGGFYGEIGVDNRPNVNAPVGIILLSRILWFFSETVCHLRQFGVDVGAYEAAAERAYKTLLRDFVDADFGGVYWEVDASGKPSATKKQIYAQAFTIYAISAYFKMSANAAALNFAWQLFDLIEQKGIDKQYQGYLEAFTRDWGVIDDLRLSEKDLNYPKSQNTHLHILEAYTALHAVDPQTKSEKALRVNIELFDKFMINKSNFHLRMFMELDWQDRSPGFTYGHDIEAAWLIARGLEVLGDSSYSEAITPSLLGIASTTLNEALGEWGQIKDAFDAATQSINADHVWWVQAEAMVGFLYAYQQAGDEAYIAAAEGLWAFINKYQRDLTGGEWLWLSTLNTETSHVPNYKAGFWKCPYHNGRAMIEADNYLQKIRAQS